MSRQWKLAPAISGESAKKLLNYPALLAQLLYNRGFVEPEKAETFLNLKYEGLNSPFLFLEMKKAADRIWRAIEQKEKICVYGDYDADAVTANAVLKQTFLYLGIEVASYIPDRFSEGYGVNLDALSKIKDSGAKIIITVDCGTNSADAADFCRNNGIDLIITDHHEIIGQTPEAYALINPKNPNDEYPDENITGAGVAFKLACGILSDGDRISKHFAVVGNGLKPFPTEPRKQIVGYEKWLLDLVAIGTVADCHSLLGENRILVKYGLKVLAKTRWPGLRALIKTAGLDFNQRLPDTYTLGFIIAPRLNAAGRLEHANVALDLLMEQNPATATEKALALEEINRRRQESTERMMSEAREQAELIKERKFLVVMKEDWPKGVVGLVAGRLADEFHRPTIALSKEGNTATGSARTVGGFNVVEALKHTSDYLIRFGGHKQAAGLTLKVEHFELFYQKVLEYADKNLSEDDIKPVLELEAELSEKDLQPTTYNLLTGFEPFGVDNPKPKFLIKNMKILSLRPVGAQKQHLQLKLQKGGRQIDGIGFNMSYVDKTLKIGDTVDVAAELIEDGWNGRADTKLKVFDIKVS